jgi:hypothetical protein
VTNICVAFNIDIKDAIEEGQPFNLFCPAKQNPLKNQVEYWTYDRQEPQGMFMNGTVWKPIGSLAECDVLCSTEAEGTAYITDDPVVHWGLAI